MFVYFGFVLSMFKSIFKAELCTGPGQAQNRNPCEGGKHLPDEGGLLELGPSAVHGKQCKRFTDLMSVVSILQGQMKELLTLCPFFSDWKLVLPASQGSCAKSCKALIINYIIYSSFNSTFPWSN